MLCMPKAGRMCLSSGADLVDKRQDCNHLALLEGLSDDALDVQVLVAHRLALRDGEPAQPRPQVLQQASLRGVRDDPLTGQEDPDVLVGRGDQHAPQLLQLRASGVLVQARCMHDMAADAVLALRSSSSQMFTLASP